MSLEPEKPWKCCNDPHNPSKYKIEYNGKPASNYIVLICSIHYKEEPWNRNIIKVEAVN